MRKISYAGFLNPTYEADEHQHASGNALALALAHVAVAEHCETGIKSWWRS
jgi:hypothetical protein